LSTLFLLARTIDPNNAIPIAEVDVEDRLREPRMTAPEYTGTTSDGASILLTATEARQDDGGSASAKGIVGKMVMPDGGEITLTAAKGNIDDANGVKPCRQNWTVPRCRVPDR
jgi:lipopolysaccharide export system protein LptC